MEEELDLRMKEWESFYILYENKDENSQYGCLDKEILLKAKKLEQFIQEQPEWENLCLADAPDDPSCNST